MKILPVIHANNLNLYHLDPDDNNRNNVVRPIIDLKQKDGKEVEEVIADKTKKRRKSTKTIHEFLIKWKNLPIKKTNWECAKDLTG